MDMEVLIGRHLYLHTAKKCSCGARTAGPLGSSWSWYIGHLAESLEIEGFGRVRI